MIPVLKALQTRSWSLARSECSSVARYLVFGIHKLGNNTTGLRDDGEVVANIHAKVIAVAGEASCDC